MSSPFTLLHSSPIGRRGRLETAHGPIETPFFMPVGTACAMKGLTHEDLLALGAQILLCNTYHLHLHPGEDTVAKAGGLHHFIHWEKPILTDSGGYQVFSMARIRSIDDSGVTFRSHVDGSEHRLDPKSAMEIQHKLGAGIIMGGLERDLREKCAQELIAMGFDGYAVGGLAVGESEQDMYGVLDSVCPLLPE